MTHALNRIRQQSKVDSEAIEKLEEAAKLNPEDPNVYRSLIRAYRRDREHAKALEVSRKLLEIDPLNISGIIGRGEVLYEQGHFAEAEATFRHAMDLAKQIGEEEVLNLYTNLGRCCVMQGS